MYLQMFGATNLYILFNLLEIKFCLSSPQFPLKLHISTTMKTSNHFYVEPLKDTVSVGLQRDYPVAAL